MTRERIEDMREVVLPFVKKRLLETNYENLGESDAEMFAKDFNEILNLAIKALEQEPRWIPVGERLPEKYTYTLWCATSGEVRSDYFNGKYWQEAKRYCYEVVAWMPLPLPWKGE